MSGGRMCCTASIQLEITKYFLKYLYMFMTYDLRMKLCQFSDGNVCVALSVIIVRYRKAYIPIAKHLLRLTRTTDT